MKHVVMINCDASPFLEREILTTVTALANAGGGTVYLEGERLKEKSLCRQLCDYVTENTYPQIFPLSDILFPETHWRLTIPAAETFSATLKGGAYGFSKNGNVEKLFPKFKIKAEEATMTVGETVTSALDRETAAKVAKKLGRTEKYQNIDRFEPEVLYSVLNAARYDGENLRPTVFGIMTCGKSDAVADLCPYIGAVYTAYTPKRKKKRTADLTGKNLFSQREALLEETVKDLPAAKDFLFVLSHAFLTAISLRDLEKQSPTRVFNRNGVIEITFPQKKTKEQTFGTEKSAFSRDVGKIFKAENERFFKAGSRKVADGILQNAGFAPIKIEKRASFAKITVDLKHKK